MGRTALTLIEVWNRLKARYIGKTVPVLERNHPAGILRRKRAYLIEFLHLFFAKPKVNSRQVLLQLIDALGPNDDGADKWFGKNPGQCNRGHAGLMSRECCISYAPFGWRWAVLLLDVIGGLADSRLLCAETRVQVAG